MRYDLKKDKLVYLLLFLMFFIDFAFMFLHVFYKLNLISNSKYLITKDHGYAESFQYIKEVLVAGVFFLAALKKNKSIYFAWSLLFLYVFIDDCFRVHEKIGSLLKHRLGIGEIFGINPQNVGELLVTVFVGSTLILILGISYYYSEKEERKFSQIVFLLVIMLGFFGVVVDIGGALVERKIYRGILALIEDGGEMVVMSLILFYILKIKIYKKSYMNLVLPPKS
jgi:hypothetical protein